MLKKCMALCLLVIMSCGCETTLNETQSGTLVGSALGAGLGAIIGNQTGHAGAGTAIGAGAGALTGALVGEGMRRQKVNNQQTQYQAPNPAYSQVSSPQVQQIHTKFCPRCGRTYPEQIKFCQDDGSELQFIK